MPRNPQREQRPLAEQLRRRAKEYSEGLIFRLEISSTTVVKPVILGGHNIQSFVLDLRSSGFSGELDFMVSDDSALLSTERDALLTMFRAADLIKLRLTLQAHWLDEDVGAVRPTPIEVNGLVSERALTEHVADLGNSLVSFRHYFIRFADAAQVLWRQHFPCELYTQKSLRQVIDAQRNLHIVVEYPDTEVGVVTPMIFLGCDAEHRGSERASFYDLLMWRLDEMGKVWMYDYTRKVYQIYGTKPRPLAFDIIPHDLDRIYAYYPEYPRYQKNVLNDFVDSVQNRPIDNLKKVVGIRQDHLYNTEIQSDFDQKVQRRTTAFMMPRPEFVIHYGEFPSKPFAPNVGVDFQLDKLDLAGEDIAVPLEATTELCRVYRIQLSGRTGETDVRPVYDGLVPAKFHCRTEVFLELASDPELRLPPYVLPRYPVPIEGRIVSEAGTPLDETYQFYPETTTMLPRYKVMIPLWANQLITTPYNPNTLPGQFYFPAYKYERVLLDLYFDRAAISQFREWRATAQLPQDTQGDQLLLGKNPLNRTAMQHFYENERPVFQIERMNLMDNELVKIAEGNLLLQVGTPPLGTMTGTPVGRQTVLPLGMPAVPPRGSPPMPGGLPLTSSPPVASSPTTPARPGTAPTLPPPSSTPPPAASAPPTSPPPTLPRGNS